MTAPPAPLPGRRASLGAAAALAGFLLLAPPLYLLGPFALLTLLARPRTLRELLWLAAAIAGIAAALSGGGALGPELLRASGFVVSTVFVVLSLQPRGGVFLRALLAVALSVVGLGLWAWSSGIAWSGVESAFANMLRVSYQAMVDLAGPDGTSRQDMQRFVQPFIEAAPEVARMMPGVLALQALLGLVLASAWHHRISVSPLGAPPEQFRKFRFNDHLVWGAIFTLAMALAPLPSPVTVVALNLLIVWGGLYAARGFAVVTTFLAPAPAPLKVLTAGFALLLLPLVLGATVALGLADTWLDIRGKLRPPAPEGV
jgi:hypothetical protein